MFSLHVRSSLAGCILGHDLSGGGDRKNIQEVFLPAHSALLDALFLRAQVCFICFHFRWMQIFGLSIFVQVLVLLVYANMLKVCAVMEYIEENIVQTCLDHSKLKNKLE